MPPLFNFSHLRKCINGNELLTIDELVLEQAQCILLRGDNGAGKSTLMRVLAGLVPADTLSLKCDGAVIDPRSQRAGLRNRIVYLHQQPYLFDSSVFENVAYGLKRRGLPRDIIRQRVQAGLAWSQLAHLSARNGKRLSGGERQRVALVRAYVLKPSAMLLDEPTAGMDADSRRRALALIGKMCSEGMSILLSSHEYIADMGFIDRCLRLENGRLQAVARKPTEGSIDGDPIWR